MAREHTHKPTPKGALLARYDHTAQRAAAQVIAGYSTSFSAATRLLSAPIRQDIRNLYAMVRIADEIVDGTASQAQSTQAQAHNAHTPSELLERYRKEVLDAPKHRFHTDLIIHAYALTARRCDFQAHEVEAFFSAMRTDLTPRGFTAEDLSRYIYGSAEVIGLMCLKIFLRGHSITPAQREVLERGARSLGAGFQKVNFLRDASFDQQQLGRHYIADAASHRELATQAREDLEHAKAAITLLPAQARYGVAAATELYEHLLEKVEQPQEVRRRVPGAAKAFIVVRAVARTTLHPESK
ncbi:phytoene/squalene synthase family protein [Corynebacterium kozikiae]|uniref:phytoene/squalene synthase family protein n=1 Tax=Corynebacterium kozikiae TaxID=2968469 RepID=UPI00211BDE9D|nr:squalene/phytoene synthase family protein [Corynebacterium sp. 76QC2CO]MCQ9343145.1 squalene/phytoene synthase family protein [Corynebacterium sp. 76QC2CO]